MKHSIRRRTSDADQYADHGTWYDEAGYGDRNAADYQSHSIPVLMGKPLRRFPQAPSLGLRAHLLTTCKQAVVSLRARALSEGVFRSLRRATGTSI